MSIGILIADDQALVRAGFRMIIEAQDDLRVVAEARDGGEAVEASRRSRPDIVLMDIRMPTIDGLEATRRIMAAADEPPRVLILTTYDLDEYVFDALHAGASGFLLKDVPPEHLVAGNPDRRGGRFAALAVRDPAPDRVVRPSQHPRAEHRRSSGSSRHANSRSSPWSRAVSRTPRSPISSWFPERRSRHTLPGCSRSCDSATASRRSCLPTRPASSGPARTARISNDRAGTRASTREPQPASRPRRPRGSS